MQTFIAILRGINVSGQKKILMADLKMLFEELQFHDVQTYIQSGNVVFKTASKLSDIKLADKIEKAILKKFNFAVPVIIRTKEEMEKIVATNLFAKKKNIDLKKLHVTFLSELPKKKTLKALIKLIFLLMSSLLKEKKFIYTSRKVTARPNFRTSFLKIN